MEGLSLGESNTVSRHLELRENYWYKLRESWLLQMVLTRSMQMDWGYQKEGKITVSSTVCALFCILMVSEFN